MTIVLEQYTLPEQGTVKLNIHHRFEIKVTAQEARRKIDDWLFDDVSYMMTAGTPTLVVGNAVVWRVPAILTASHVGHVGVVGNVDINVETGLVNSSHVLQEQLLQAARDLAAKLLISPPSPEISSEELATEESYPLPVVQPTRRIPNFATALR